MFLNWKRFKESMIISRWNRQSPANFFLDIGLNYHVQVILTTRQQAMIVDQLLRVFVRLLQETSAQFIGENNTQVLAQ